MMDVSIRSATLLADDEWGAELGGCGRSSPPLLWRWWWE
jgi:hypothetical protein